MPNQAGTTPLKNARHERYAIARASGAARREAYLACGGQAKSVAQAAYSVENADGVQARISAILDEAKNQAIAINTVTRGEIITSTRHIRELAVIGTPVLAKDGTPTGIYKPDFAAANRSNEILAKMHGFMLDVMRVEDFDTELDGMNQEELQAFVLSLLEQLDPNLRKQLMAQLEPEAEVIEIEAGGRMQ